MWSDRCSLQTSRRGGALEDVNTSLKDLCLTHYSFLGRHITIRNLPPAGIFLLGHHITTFVFLLGHRVTFRALLFLIKLRTTA